MSTAKDERETPPGLFEQLNREGKYTLDAAASRGNALCAEYCDIDHSGLEADWTHHRVWANPPFSELEAWTRKAFLSWCAGCKYISLLLPADRCEQPFWQLYIEPVRDLSRAAAHVRTEFLAGRTHFLVDGKPIINPKTGKRSSPKFGIVVVTFINP